MPEFISQDVLNTSINSYADSYGYQIDQLTFNFVSKERQLMLNEQFLNHDTHTDIITFDYSKNKSLKAEINQSNEFDSTVKLIEKLSI